MAHVLLPTDLSDNALNAAVYAVRLFGGEGNRFTVLNTYVVSQGTTIDMWDASDMIVRGFREGLDRSVERLRAAFPGMDLDLEAVCVYGDLSTVIAGYAGEDEPPAMVVMGTQGASGLDEVLFGSNTASVIKHGHLPVLAVPAQAEYKTPRRVLLADDGGPTDKQTLSPLIDIARWSQSEITVVRVMDEAGNTENSGGVAQLYDVLLGAIPHTQQFLSGHDVGAALNDLADQSDADLLVVLHRDRGVFEGLFHRSVAANMAMHTHLPLLVLQQPRL
ncbi:MAG: universal stress protein [Flavobacteriales bacterium]|nr:universal stress protein [Flavobacteriales bacterium]